MKAIDLLDNHGRAGFRFLFWCCCFLIGDSSNFLYVRQALLKVIKNRVRQRIKKWHPIIKGGPE